MTAPTLAVDFGTSNSAAAILDAGRVRRLALEGDDETLPTAVFFPVNGRMQIGRAAGAALIGGEDGRYMRALKSVLGTALFHESRLVGGKRQTLANVVTAFLAEAKGRAEAQTDMCFDRVLSGRPVHFHDRDPDRDEQAEADLKACYEAAGFARVDFLFEPEAAARAAHGIERAGQIGLIVDIGGGTSDFSVVRGTEGGAEVLASHGIRLGGTDFDRALSLAQAMPLLGLGGSLRRDFGEGLLPVPNALFVELATWAKIAFLYTPETRRAVADLIRHATCPRPLRRLGEVIEHELGHELAFAVETGKIAANSGDRDAAIAMNFIEPGLAPPLSRGALNRALQPMQASLGHAMRETLFRAGVAPGDVASATLVGGSSIMSLVTDEVRATCPAARLKTGAAFTAIVDGLALATA